MTFFFFVYFGRYVRNALLHIAKADPAVFSAILLNGSGTFAIEATLKTLFQGKDKEVLLSLLFCRVQYNSLDEHNLKRLLLATNALTWITFRKKAKS